MEKSLEGKVALITGAGQGIGQGIAFAMASAGARLALLGRTEAKLQASVEEAGRRGAEAIAISGDVCAKEDLRGAVEQAIARFGGVDILVNNAQEVPMGALDEVSDEAYLRGFLSGPLASFRLMKLVRASMAQRGGGVIFNMVSSAGVRWDMSGYGAYASVKQAIRPLTRAAAAEWGGEQIRVFSIAPHAKSPGLAWWIDHNPEEAEAFFRTIPLRRIGDCETDIGEALVALCGRAFRYLTGATIPLDGGQANFD